MRADMFARNKAIFTVVILLAARFILAFLLPESLDFSLYLIAEIAVLAVINIFTRSILTKFLVLACAAIESMQLAHLYSTGNYIEPLTI